MSLPVAMFNHNTTLTKCANSVRFLPGLVASVRKETDPVMTCCQVLNHLNRLQNHNLDLTKPFNSLWGETYSVKLADFECCFEQTMHHPPVTSFYMANSDKSICYYGFNNITAKMGLNSGYAQNLGTEYFKIDGKLFHILQKPEIQLNKVLYGKRFVTLSKKLLIWFESVNLLTVLF